MCGIIGYIGPKAKGELLLEGLRSLEYRGYDSAGVSVWEDARILTVKSEGNLDHLEDALSRQPLDGGMGIGHTRWATHGQPSEANAHPHLDCSGRITLVHNGILENFQELKKGLQERGHRFSSDTDSEVLVHLIEENMDGCGLAEAVRKALRQVRGSYAVACFSLDVPGVMVGARMDSPLLVGVGDGEMFLASAIPAFLRHTRRAVLLKNGDIVELSQERYVVMDLEGAGQSRGLFEANYDVDAAEKGGYEDFMLKEIYEQPVAWADTLRGNPYSEARGFTPDFLPPDLIDPRGLARIIFIACGTSYHAALLARYVFERWMDIPVEVDIASEFRYREPKLDSKTLVVAISQSGETADTMAALRGALERKSRTVCIVNTLGSQMTQDADAVIHTHAGPEIGVAATKTFIVQIAAVYLLGLYLAGRTRFLDRPDVNRIMRELEAMPAYLEKVLQTEDLVREYADKYYQCEDFLFLGRNINYPVAMEGALKLKEISYIHAEGYPAGEMKHGPIALLHPGFPVVALAPRDPVYEKMVSNLEEIRARRAPALAVATEGDRDIAAHCDQVIYIPEVDPILNPILITPVLQMLAYHIAKKRGCNVDQPRNLAKTVTVE
jgi:glucosamine--fructose-6-phosphate aminotransferase (isomerizing)